MSKHYTLFLILLCCIVFANSTVMAQDRPADSVQLHTIAKNMEAVFNKAIGDRSGLYNGPAFIPYNFRSKTNANFKDTTSFSNGAVNYDGVVYTNVPLIYNLHKEVLVSHLYNGFSLYTFLNDRVYTFDLLDHHFVRILADTVNKQLTTGFFDELYNNKLRLLARRTKSIQEESSLQGISSIFVPKTEYFLKKGTMYYNVNSQGKFFDVLKDRKKELKQYLKDNKIKFGDNPEQAMITLAAYYDHLNN